jgi:molybdopterin converting factor small subunit
MRVLIPSALLSYTGQPWVSAEGATVGEVLQDLDRSYPGIRFRMIDEQGKMRRHMRFFCAGKSVSGLDYPLRADDELFIVQALSGG